MIEIDSFKIRIPFIDCKIIDDSITGNWILVNEATGIIDEADFKNNSLSFNINGIKTKFAIEKQVTAKKTVETYIIILINSKILGKKYFEGITERNIKYIYRYLISLEVVSFSFSDFLNSEIVDVDFKRDRIQKDFKDSLDELYKIAKASKKLGQGCRLFKKNNNLGIQFSDRRTTSIYTNPFLKIYHKEIELKKGNKDSQLFYSKYLHQLKDIDKILTDRIRIEFTIKNKKHFRIFNIEDTSLKNILRIPQTLKKDMLFEILNKHITLFVFTPVLKKNNINAIDKILTNLLFIAIDENKSIPVLIENLIQNLGTKQKKYYWRKRLYRLYNTYLLDDEKLKKITKNSQDFIKWLISP